MIPLRCFRVGWFNYSDEQVAANVAKSVAAGFTAMKLKVGSSDLQRDIRRTRLVRQAAGTDATIMVDANQQWTIAQTLDFARQTKDLNLFWIEEPTHPDDIVGHRRIAGEIAPVKVAAGEHVPNRVVFKNYLQSGAMAVCRVDACSQPGRESPRLSAAVLEARSRIRAVVDRRRRDDAAEF